MEKNQQQQQQTANNKNSELQNLFLADSRKTPTVKRVDKKLEPKTKHEK